MESTTRISRETRNSILSLANVISSKESGHLAPVLCMCVQVQLPRPISRAINRISLVSEWPLNSILQLEYNKLIIARNPNYIKLNMHQA